MVSLSVSSRTTGGCRISLPALGMTQSRMKSWWEHHASPSDAVRQCSRIPWPKRAGADTFEDSLGGPGAVEPPGPPLFTESAARAVPAGWGPQRDLASAVPTAFPRPTLFPVPCQNPNRIIRPAVCPALHKHKPFPSPAWINSLNPDFYKQPAYFFGRSTVPAGSGQV